VWFAETTCCGGVGMMLVVYCSCVAGDGVMFVL